MSDSTWILIACVAFAVAVGVGQYLLDRHRRRSAIAAGEIPADDEWFGGHGSADAAARVVLAQADDLVANPHGDHRDVYPVSRTIADLFTAVWTRELALPGHIDRPSALAAEVPNTLRDRVAAKLVGVPGGITISALVLSGDWFYPPTEPGERETPSNRHLRKTLTKFARALNLPPEEVDAAYRSARARRRKLHDIH